MAKVKRTVSYSELSTYRRCPYLRLLNYDLRLRPVAQPEQYPVGLMFHDLIAKILVAGLGNAEEIILAHQSERPELDIIAEFEDGPVFNTDAIMRWDGVYRTVSTMLRRFVPELQQLFAEGWRVATTDLLIPNNPEYRYLRSDQYEYEETSPGFMVVTDNTSGSVLATGYADTGKQLLEDMGWVIFDPGQPLVEFRLAIPVDDDTLFVARVDTVLHNPNTGETIVVDWKTRSSSFVDEDQARKNTQLSLYTYLLRLLGLTVDYAISYQVKAAGPADLSINKDGSISRRYTAIPWEEYRQFAIDNDTRPLPEGATDRATWVNQEYADMAVKLADVQMTCALRLYYSEFTCYSVFLNAVATLKALVAGPAFKALDHNCYSCPMWNWCYADITGAPTPVEQYTSEEFVIEEAFNDATDL